jgi:hypothetical protein
MTLQWHSINNFKYFYIMKTARLFIPIFILTLFLQKQSVAEGLSGKNDSLLLDEQKSIPELANLGITAAEYNSLPASIKNKIPKYLLKSDSVLVEIALYADQYDKGYPQDFIWDDLSGTITQTKGDDFEVRDSQKRLLGLIHKSKDDKKRLVVNSSGNVIYNDFGLNGFAYVGMGFGALLVMYALYFLIYVAWVSTFD